MAKLVKETKIVAGRQVEVENQEKKTNANKSYITIWVEDSDGKNEECLFFTKHEIQLARERAKKNPEDIPKKGFLTNLFD